MHICTCHHSQRLRERSRTVIIVITLQIRKDGTREGCGRTVYKQRWKDAAGPAHAAQTGLTVYQLGASISIHSLTPPDMPFFI